jgi:hypothetical protein
MSQPQITAEVKDFIFQYLDSVEQLEILLLLNSIPDKYWTAQELNISLRSNLNSVEKRLAILLYYKIIDKNDGAYSFKPEDPQIIETLVQLAGCYRVHRYKVLELIFSPMKKCRDFAEAFVISAPPKDPKGESNG